MTTKYTLFHGLQFYFFFLWDSWEALVPSFMGGKVFKVQAHREGSKFNGETKWRLLEPLVQSPFKMFGGD